MERGILRAPEHTFHLTPHPLPRLCLRHCLELGEIRNRHIVLEELGSDAHVFILSLVRYDPHQL